MSCSFKLPHLPVLVAVGLLAYLITSCTETDPSKSLNGTWIYAYHEDGETGVITSEPEYIARSVVITFDDNGKKGDFYGQTVTNAIQGKYKIDKVGSITFSEINGGLRGEPEWAAGFWDALESAKSYTKENERLEISYSEGTKKLIFVLE